MCTESAEPESLAVEPHSHRPSLKDRIYTVATDHTIRSVMAEYRRRKQTHLLPRSSGAAASKPRSTRKKESRSAKVTGAGGHSASTSSDPVDRQIVEQERASIMKVRNTDRSPCLYQMTDLTRASVTCSSTQNGIGQTIIFSSCGLFYLSSFFSSPNLSRCRLDVCHTSTHGVALVQI